MAEIDDFFRLKDCGLTPEQVLAAQIMLTFKHTEKMRIQRREKPLVDCTFDEIVELARR